jgi:hypothetical protein
MKISHVLKATNMAAMQNFKVMCDNIQVMGMYANENMNKNRSLTYINSNLLLLLNSSYK